MNPAASMIRATGHPWPFNAVQETELSGFGETERVSRTLCAMAAFAHSGAVSRSVVECANASDIARRWRPQAEVLRETFYRLKAAQRHEVDPAGVELLRHPAQSASTLNAYGAFVGDCDDVAMLAASLLIVNRIGCAFRVTRRDATWEHVYVVALPNGGGEIAIDPQETDMPGMERDYADKIDALVWNRYT